jgi:hypothetical protein
MDYDKLTIHQLRKIVVIIKHMYLNNIRDLSRHQLTELIKLFPISLEQKVEVIKMEIKKDKTTEDDYDF